MNKLAISKTAICNYNKKERCFVVQSPLFERCMGIAETEKEAFKIFHELLNDYYIAYLEGRLVSYEKRGRPEKGYVELHVQVKPTIKNEIASTAKELGISQGEVIEYLYHLQVIKDNLEQRQAELEKKFKKLDSVRTHKKNRPVQYA